MWSKSTGKPLYNAIVWQDGRNAEFCEELSQTRGKEIRAKTGKDPFPPGGACGCALLLLKAAPCAAAAPPSVATGLPVFPYFSANKIAWILNNVAGVREAAEAGDAVFGTIDSWLLWKFTGSASGIGGIHVTDVTNASRTLLFNIHTMQWDAALCDAFGIPISMLPEVK